MIAFFSWSIYLEFSRSLPRDCWRQTSLWSEISLNILQTIVQATQLLYWTQPHVWANHWQDSSRHILFHCIMCSACVWKKQTTKNKQTNKKGFIKRLLYSDFCSGVSRYWIRSIFFFFFFFWLIFLSGSVLRCQNVALVNRHTSYTVTNEYQLLLRHR